MLKLLPYKKFIELFKVDIEQFDKDSYSDFLDDVCIYQDDCFIDMEYDEFMDNLNANSGYSALDEDEYDEVTEKLYDLNMLGYCDFIDDYNAGENAEFDYDPIAKSYIGNENNIFKSNQVYDVTDLMREYLRKNELPYDDETIENLSLEDAYAIMAGTYGKENCKDDTLDDEE